MHDAADRKTSLFVDAVEIPIHLHADRGRSYAERLHRDRTIGASISAQHPARRVRAWRSQVATTFASDEQSLGERLERGRRIIGFLMLILGAATGIGVASAVFHYDGTWPVNVVTVLAVLVLLQLALVALTLVLLVPRLPGIRVLQDLIRAINPGALVAAVYKRVARLEEDRADLLVWPAARGPAIARFARWQMLVWSQVGAIAFNIAALATAAALIAFTDLAFGWSTTLRIDSDEAMRMINALSFPWSSVWPEAVPSATLIESSRFFRLASAAPPNISAESLTGWWPFLLAAIVTYGLLPRLILLIVATWRLRAATVYLLLDDPQVKALLDRMSASEVTLGADGVEEPAISTSMAATRVPTGTPSQAAAIVWSNAIAREAVNAWSAQKLRKEVMQIVEAGGGRNLEDDAAVVRLIAAGRPRAVLLFVRAWEAPLLDLQDFIESLRAAVGRSCSIILVPIGSGDAAADESQRMTWSRWIARIADPALYLESGA